MKKMSFCGLDCASCPAFIATKNNDDKLREETTISWAKEYNNPNLEPEDINCLG